MTLQMKKRNEVPVELTWDLSHIFASEEAYQEELSAAQHLCAKLEEGYKDKLTHAEAVLEAVHLYEDWAVRMSRLGNYANLAVSVDMTDDKNLARSMHFDLAAAQMFSRLSFLESQLVTLSDALLDEAIAKSPLYRVYLEDIKAKKPHTLSPETEKTLAALSPVLELPYQGYEQTKLADMDFGSFTAEGKEYPLSFVLYENTYQNHPNTAVRRSAFEAFCAVLRKYQHTIAADYNAQVQKEKIIADLRGFDSVFDYLLFDQKVDRRLYDRQIDTIMEKLAPAMGRYAQLLKRIHNLEEMTFADLKISVDPSYDPHVTIEESKEYVKGALSVLGEEYLHTVMRSYEERWVDFAANTGKSTGGFCATPYGVHSYILLTWNGLLSEVFTLVHELGHAGHFDFTQKNQNYFSEEPSLYMIEAPSTCNEMFLTHYLLDKNQDPRFQRWVLSSMVANTYFHNFVTHLLEAAYQREVYKLVDKGESLQASTLNALKRSVLEKFWGDNVRINEGAEMTWMRQPHYYMGLYPYTYSAGLTVSTQVSQRILREGEAAVKDWLEVLKSGGTKSPVELAAMAGVDITTDQPLLDTIAYISEQIDKIIDLTHEIAVKSEE